MGGEEIEPYSDLIDGILNSRKIARQSYERRLFILLGFPDQLARVVRSIATNILYEKDSIIVSSNYKRFREDLSRILSDKSEQLKVISNWDTDKILGQTFDIAIIDLRDWPDVISLSRIIGTVRRGGVIILMLPYDYNTKIYREEIVPPYFAKPPRKLMLRRLVEKSIGYEGVYIYDLKRRGYIWGPKEKEKKIKKKEIKIPEETMIPKEIYELAASQDQVEVIKAFEEWGDFIILLANRGRGKSSSIGLGLTGYAWIESKKLKRPLYICLTSRSKSNVEEIFRFAQVAHKALNIEFEYNQKDATFKSNILRLEFENPHRAIRISKIADALVIDEVAAVPFHILQRLVRAFRKIIFSGTVHGYEGTGRIFAIRFLRMLDSMNRAYIKIELKEPIRYSENDPVEKWLFDMLFMDAEPAKVDESILKLVDRAKLIELKPHKYFLGSEKEEEFIRSIIGILTTAHYRNNPKDILLMCDAPHHRIFALVIDSVPVVALQIAEEGGIPQSKLQEMLEEAPSGHLIPDNIFRYTGMTEFPILEGLRIVRIATHPRLQGQGLGSLAIRKLVELAKEENKNWIGASFGVTPELLNFWLKNGFLVANMSPILNPKTGEFSAIVIKPLNKRTKFLVLEANKQLKLRLLRELRNSYWELEPETALLMLKQGDPIQIIPHLTSGDVFRVGLYLNIGGKLEACIDVVDELVKLYFARKYNFLSRSEELLLIKKIGQRRIVERDELPKLKDIIKKLWNNLIRTRYKAGREK